MMLKYPEHEKLQRVKEQSQAIGEFLQWCADTKNLGLAHAHSHDETCYGPHEHGADKVECAAFGRPYLHVCGIGICSNNPHQSGCDKTRDRVCIPEGQFLIRIQSVESLLSEFFEVDLMKLEQEKRAMLAELRRR